MKMRAMSLLVLTLVVVTAPAALASHCRRCRPDTQACVTALNFGFQFCEWDPLTGECFGVNPCHLTAPVQPLAAEFEVASVERIDEPEPKVIEILIASNDDQQR